MEAFLQDLRVGARGLRRSPAFTLTAVLTLALGIGLATAVLTVANALLLRPLPVRDQDRLAVVQGASRDGRLDNFPLLLSETRDYAAGVTSMERVEFFSYGGAHPASIREGATVFRARRALVSGGYFDLLGARPALGRALGEEDDVAGAAPVVVLSHAAWQRYYGGDPAVVGRELLMHETGVAHRIVGVMPLGLDYPRGVDFWAPVAPNSRPLGDDPLYAELNVIGRLRPGASPADAGAELSAYFARPGAPAWHAEMLGVARPLEEAVLGDVRPAMLAFAAAAGLLLLIACINVANLQLVRGLARVREVAVRSALGAARGRVVRQLVTESALLAAGGGLLGAALATVAMRAFVALAPAGMPRLDELRVGAGVLGSALAIAAAVTLLFALAPAVVSSRVQLGAAMRADARGGGPGRAFRLGTEALVLGQVALTVLVLAAAGLITRSLLRLERVELAFDPAGRHFAELALPYEGLGDTGRHLALLDRLVPRVEAVPGVRSVAPVLTSPFAPGGIVGQIAAEGQSESEMVRNPALVFEVVTPGYFETLGIRLLRGRAFSDADREGSPPVAIVSESAARHYWPGGDPIGGRLVAPGGEVVTVIGVVPETRYRDLREPRASIYFPLRQSSFPVAPMTLAIRTDGPASALAPSIRAAVREADPRVALASLTASETLVGGQLTQPRLNALLLATFALSAVLLAAVGLYAIMATMVRLRTREIGVRMALGATARDVGGLVLRRGMGVAGLGVLLGLLGALAANRLLAALLFEVTPTDAPTLLAVAAGLLAVAAGATLLPARSSTRVDPAVALRAD